MKIGFKIGFFDALFQVLRALERVFGREKEKSLKKSIKLTFRGGGAPLHYGPAGQINKKLKLTSSAPKTAARGSKLRPWALQMISSQATL